MPTHERAIAWSHRHAATRSPRLPAPRRARAGMTLPELLIVATIITILTAIGLPHVRGALRGQATTAAVDEFTQTTALARSTAQRYGRAAQLHVNATTGKFWVDVDTSGAGQRGIIGSVHDITGNKVALTTTAATLCFDPRGLASSSSGCQTGAVTVTFASTMAGASTTKTLTVTTLGKVIR